MTDELESASEETPLDVSVPRECIYQSFEGQPGPCPRCGSSLQQSYQSYLIATRRGNKVTDSFMMSNKMGWFCTHCPVVVINPAEVSRHLPYGLPKWDVGNEFVVAGIINLDAVPQDKRELPLGEADNPIPLVGFTNVSDELAGLPKEGHAPTASARKKKKAKKKKIKHKKRKHRR